MKHFVKLMLAPPQDSATATRPPDALRQRKLEVLQAQQDLADELRQLEAGEAEEADTPAELAALAQREAATEPLAKHRAAATLAAREASLEARIL